MVTLETLSADAIDALRSLYDIIIPVARIGNPNPANIYLMDRGDLLFTFTKINLWRQTQFRKIVYVDADIVALRATDELFDIDAPFAAAPDIGWPDCFNSGLMVITPNMGDFWALQTLASTGNSFDGADQGLLNQYYEHRGWHRLSFTYNCTPNAEYQWEPAYKHYKSNIKMVHFIGKNKPWFKGRQSRSKQGGIYSDLVNQWWAVYDRHLKYPTFSYTPGKHHAPRTMIVQQQVFGEAVDQYYGVPQEERIAPPAITEVAPAFHARSDPIDHGHVEPQRKFSAPHMEWDATRGAPPAESRPEAAQFPTMQYDFNESRSLFQPPTSYPEPPKDMYYEVPEAKPKTEDMPAPIFPWEKEHDRPKPSRKFAEDMPPEEPKQKRPAGISIPPVITVADDIFTPFTPQANAWDANPQIERYVRAVMESQNRQKSKASPKTPTMDLMSPTGENTVAGRRGSQSLILTDFPTADDRPSLPVTPAPIRRPSFWGEERDESGELPAAEGVPDQAEWNPTQKLEELRRSSLLEVEHLKAAIDAAKQTTDQGRRLSNRDMPAHAAPLPPAHNLTSPTESDARHKGSNGNNGSSKSQDPLSTVPEEDTTPSTESSSRHPGSSDGTADPFSPIGGTSTTDTKYTEPDILSPKSQTAHPSFSVATLEAGMAGHADMFGRPAFSEPDFGPEAVVVDELEKPVMEEKRRSPGSFSAEVLRESETISPTER